MTARQDFIEAYTTVFTCSREFADSLLRQVETDYADTENKQLQDLVDQAAVESMQSQEVAALRKDRDEWKGWEAEARGAVIQIAELLGRDDLMSLLQAGCYGRVVTLLQGEATKK